VKHEARHGIVSGSWQAEWLNTLSSIYTGSWKDLYHYFRCPKILAPKAYLLLRMIDRDLTTIIIV
jgi:hypothetical protein